jgi:pyruvate dehydrogenase E1 component beta subunit
MVPVSLEVAGQLKGKVNVEVVDPRTLEPLDIDTIVKSVKKTGRAVIVDEDTKRCSVTSEIAAQITEKAFDSLKAPVQRVAADNIPIPGSVAKDHVLP